VNIEFIFYYFIKDIMVTKKVEGGSMEVEKDASRRWRNKWYCFFLYFQVFL